MFEVDVLDAQPARFTHAQSQSVQDGEEREVSTASLRGSAFAQQGLGKREQPLGCDCVENERCSLIPRATWRRSQWCLGELSMIDQIREQSPERTVQVVIAPRARPWTREQELVHSRWGQLVEPVDVVVHQVSIEQGKRLLLDIVASPQRALVGEELVDVGTKKALKTRMVSHSTSSPLPRATSRSCSMAIFP